MERATKSWKALRTHAKKSQLGTSIVEAVIALPILLAVILGAIQFALIYEAKATLNHASLQAARLGAVRHADPEAIRRGLARGLAALHSPDSSLGGFASTRASIETSLATDARIRILNPTREAFDDFAVDVDGEREIPNDRLHARSTAVGAQSGVNIQDANLLKVQITYGYELQVPLINGFIARALLGVSGGADTFEQQLLRRMRLPIMATATVRMQSPARLSDVVVARSEFPDLERIPSNAGPPPVRDEREDEGSSAPEGDASPSSGNGGEDRAGLDDGFMGFGVGGPSGGGGVGAGDGADEDGSSGGGVNGGNPLQCSTEDGSPAPFPFDARSPGESNPIPFDPNAWLDEGGASGSGASIESVSLASLSVGNPIHVATGNKFQTEVDLDALPGVLGIEFRRHYNSSAVKEPSVVGAGWRHSYQATLRRTDDRIEIVQADGRLIVFRKDASSNPSTTRFTSQRASDGSLIETEQGIRWLWRAGREVVFDSKGRLVRMRAQGADLVLRYDADVLISVIDPQRRELRFEYYPNGRLASVRGPGGARATYSYDGAGNLVQVASSDGRARRYAYEDARHPHHLSSISVGNVRPRAYGEKAAFERVSTWAYDERGRAVYSSHPDDAGKVTLEFRESYTDVTDAFGRKTRYLLGWREGVAYVQEVRGPGCGSCGLGDVSYEYGDRFQPLSATNRSQRLHYAYDDDVRLVRIDREIGGVREWIVRYAYEEATTRVSRIERPSVNADAVTAVELVYSPSGKISRVREVGFSPEGDAHRAIAREMNLAYDDQDRLRRIDGPRTDADDWTDFDYDDVGRIVAIKTPGGERRMLEHDASGRPTHIVQTGRPSLKIAYDARGRVTSIVQLRARGQIEATFFYDHAGRLARVVDARGRSVRYGFDAAGRPNRMSSSDSGVRTVARYAPDDRIERIAAFRTDGQLLRTLYYVYDAERRLTEIRDGAGQPLRQLAYSNDDWLPDRMTDPMGSDTGFTYDVLGRLSATLAPDGGVTHVEYDRRGRTAQVIVPNDATTAFLYDDFGRRVRERSADRGETKYLYDAAGNLVEKSDARGATLRLKYDAAHRVIEVERAEGVSTLSYSNGLLTQVDGELADERYEYDRDAQLVAHRRTIGGRTFTTRFSYDVHGRLVARELPSGERLRYGYAANGTLQSVTQDRSRGDRVLVQSRESGSNESVRLDPHGSISFGNGLSMRTTLDVQSGNLARREIAGVAGLTYAHDDARRITSIRRDDGAREYRYDAVNRLTRASTPRGVFEFAYDRNGNRVSELSPSPAERGRVGEGVAAKGTQVEGRTVYEYAPSTNRLVRVDGNTRFTYDAAGNPLTVGSRRYEYDTNGRPVKLFESGRLVAEYRYNFWGERVQKVLHANGRRIVMSYIYEQQKLVAEADERGNVTREYVYLGHHPVALLERGRAFWIHTDHLGTPIAVTNDERKVVWSADHDPFGDAVIDADPDGDKEPFVLNLRFPGQYADAEAGTSYNYFRDYDPRTGRYLTSDPIGIVGGLNSFEYARANPLAGTDTLGLYDQMVHYYMTYFLGLVAGLPQDVARTIAIATQFVDENDLTEPIQGIATPNERALPLYHFVMDYDRGAYGDNNDNRYLRFQSPSSDQLNNLIASTDPTRLRELWLSAHPNSTPGTCSVPSFGEINNARYQLFGEFLHAFEDTFAHRDAYNMPYAMDSHAANTPVAWLGHTGPNIPDLFGHAPDNTYNQNYASPSRCTVVDGQASVVVNNLSRTECAARGGRNYVAADDRDTTECEVRYVLGGTSMTRGVTESECAALGRGPGALSSTYRPGTGQIFAFNELRTLRMEYEVLSRIRETFANEIASNRANGATSFTWFDVAGLPDWDRSNPWNNARIGSEQGIDEWAAERGYGPANGSNLPNPNIVLQQFNSSRSDERDRLAILNAWLRQNDLPQIETWTDVEQEAHSRRQENIGWIGAGSFDGVLLPADGPCMGRGCSR